MIFVATFTISFISHNVYYNSWYSSLLRGKGYIFCLKCGAGSEKKEVATRSTCIEAKKRRGSKEANLYNRHNGRKYRK